MAAVHTTFTWSYHSRFMPEGVAEVTQIFLRNTHVLPKLVMRNTVNVTNGKPIAVLLQSISGSPFTTSMEVRER
jgi:hypothetical protein